MIDEEYTVVLMPFPGDIRAVVRIMPDGWATIFINDKLSPEAMRRTLDHELRHLARDDMYNLRSIRQVECQRRPRQATPGYKRKNRTER